MLARRGRGIVHLRGLHGLPAAAVLRGIVADAVVMADLTIQNLQNVESAVRVCACVCSYF